MVKCYTALRYAYIWYEILIYEKYLSVDAVTLGICGNLW